MADDTSSGSIQGMLSRKVGPLPVYAWVVAAAAVGFVLYRMGFGQKAGTSSGGSSGPGPGDQFSSSTTQSGTTPSGGQYSSSYSAQGNGYLPGQLTYAASPMPVSGGDIYVNVPTQSNTTSTTVNPPTPATPTKPFVTSKGDASDNNALNIATQVYGLTSNQNVDAVIGASEIVSMNPQIDWAQPLPVGTTVNVPLRWISNQFANKTTPYNTGDNPQANPSWAIH